MKDLIHLRVSIRAMQEKDILEVVNIERLSFSFPWTSRLFHVEIKKKNFSYYWVLEFEAKIIGYAGYWKMQDEAHLVTFAIHPSYRKRGLGRFLLAHVLKDMRSKGIRGISLEVRKSNLPAQCLYQEFGFKKVAIQPKYYHDTGEDAIIYCKKIGEML